MSSEVGTGQISNTKRGLATARKVLLVLLLCAYAMLWLGGIFSYCLLPAIPDNLSWAAQAFLLLASLLAIFTARSEELMALLVIGLLGFCAEVVGVHNSFLFGEYSYKSTLGSGWLGVPPVMACAWLTLATYASNMMLLLRWPRWSGVMFAALLMTAIDLLIDPLAAGRLNYWHWAAQGNYYGVPASNFFGWFFVSIIIFTLIKLISKREQAANIYACHIGISIILFFTIIALASHLMIAAMVGISLCIAHTLIFIPSVWKKYFK
jgi:putative membrane protein